MISFGLNIKAVHALEPNAPTSFLQSNSLDANIAEGKSTDETSIDLSVQASDGDASDTLSVEFEVRNWGVAFSNVATNTETGIAYSGTTVTVETHIPALVNQTHYHWQARVCDTTLCSTWVEFGSNPAGFDFQVLTGANDCPVGDGNTGDGDSTADGNITISSSTTWTANLVNSGTFDCSGKNIVINNNATLNLVSYNNGDTAYDNDFGIVINTDNLEIASGSKINLDQLGYPKGYGPGYAAYGSSHGGYGYPKVTPYGNFYQPVDLGTGGGAGDYGKSGGGAVKLNVTNKLVNNGEVSADAGDASGCHDGGATGGSIWVNTNTLVGSGVFSVNGGEGDCYAGGGSGGRMAIYYANNSDGVNSNFTFDYNHIQAFGQDGSWDTLKTGGAGTIYVEQTGVDTPNQGSLYIDNNNYTNQSAYIPEGTYHFKSIYLSRRGHLEIAGSASQLNVTTSSEIGGDSTYPDLYPYGTFNYTGSEPLTINGWDLNLVHQYSGFNNITIGNNLAGGLSLHPDNSDNSGVFNFGDIIVGSSGRITMFGMDSTEEKGPTLNADNLTLNSGGFITADQLGFAKNVGPGYSSTGSSHGGYGYANVSPYGDLYAPVTLGSGGGYEEGGGAIKLNIANKFINNGEVSADGGSTNQCHYGGSTGGSIWTIANTLVGSGKFTANGGQGACNAGGGSGGRIALYYGSNTDGVNTDFTFDYNHIEAFGNRSSWSYDRVGGAGTIYVENTGVDGSHQGTLLLDNNNHRLTGRSSGLLTGHYSFKNINMTRNVKLTVIGNTSTLNLPAGNAITGDNTGTITMTGTATLSGTVNIQGATLDAQGDFTTNTNDLTLDTNGKLKLYAWTQKRSDNGVSPTNQYSFDTLIMNSGSQLTLASYDNGDANYSNDYGVELISNSFTQNSGATITANGLGYATNLGDGAGTSGDTGGTHAGFGAINCSGTLGSKYGSETEPTLPGSGGAGAGGGYGGGAIKLTTNGNMTVNGTISANGANASADNSGAGSGGSIWIYTSGNFAGSTGSITTNGGSGSGTCRSGGGGGRIAIQYGTNSYTGATQSIAGTGGAGAEGGSIYTTALNANPDAVSALGPSSLVNGSYTTDTTPTFEFTLSDADGDQVKYQIQIDNDSDYSSPIVDYTSALGSQGLYNFTVGQAVGSGTYTVGSESQTLADGTYYWQVQAIDENDASSGYTQANNGSIAFGVDTINPTTPGDPSTTTPTNDNTPEWNWTASTDDGSGLHTNAYTVQWCTNSSFTGCESNVDSATSNNYIHTVALSDGTWYFRVKARDQVSNESSYSNISSVLIDTTPPTNTGPPNTTSPTTDTTPTWTWSGALDDGNPVSTYYVQWCTGSSFSGCAANIDTTNTTSYTHTTPLSEDVWYFRVWSYDALGNQSNYSSTRTVNIDIGNPSVPGTPSTTNPTNDLTPTWTWTASTDSGAGLGNPAYSVQWCNNSSFTNCESNVGTSSSNSYTHTSELSDGAWYLRVKAIDAVGHESSFSNTGGVLIDTSWPLDPGQPTTTTTPTTDTTPVWSWSPSYDEGDGQNVDNYYVYWCDNSSFSGCSGYTDTTSNTNYTHSVALADDRWYFRVQGEDSIGNLSNYSPTGTVVVDTSPPTTPTTPTTNNPTNDSTPRWDWNGGTDAGAGLADPAYTIQWCDENTFTTCPTNLGYSNNRYFSNPTSLTDGTWYIRVKAEDILGHETSWSSTGSTLIDTSDPSQPGTPSTDTPTADTTPTWTWSGVADPDLDYYLIEWCSDNGFTTDCSTGTSGSNNYTHTSSLSDGYWYVRVQSRDTAGNYSTPSATGVVLVAANPPSAPGRPLTDSPTSNQTPTWTWTTPVFTGAGLSGTTPYRVSWCQDSSFNGCASNIQDTDNTYYTHTSLLSEGTWYFRVNATDALDNTSEWSLVGTVLIDRTDPADPVQFYPSNKDYINTTRPTFKWYSKYAGSDQITEYKININNGESGSFSIGPFPSYSSSTINTNTHFVNFVNFQDVSSENDAIELYTKSSNQWSTDQNNGELKQGERTWQITAYDSAGNSASASKTLFVDLNSPSLQNLSIGGVSVSDQTNITTTSPSFSGRVTDVRTGDTVSRYVASGPKKITILIEKQNTFGYQTHSNISLNFDHIYWSDSGALITDNTQNTANKTTDFSYNLSNSLSNGTYRVTFTAQDIAGNSSSRTITLNVGTAQPTPSPTPSPSPSPSPSPTPSPSPSPKVVASPSPVPTATPSGTIDQIGSSVNQTIDQVSDTINNTITNTVDQINQTIDSTVEQVTQTITQITTDVGTTISEITTNTVKAIAEGVIEIGKILGEALPDDAQDALATITAPILNSPLAQNIQMTLDIWLSNEPTEIYDLHASEIGDDYAIITWKTNHFATSKVSYGPDRDYGLSVTSDKKTKDHLVIIKGLDSNTTYYYEVMSYGKNYAYDAWHEFATSWGGIKLSDLDLSQYEDKPITVPQISSNPAIQKAIETTVVTTVKVTAVTVDTTIKAAEETAPIAPAVATVAIPAISFWAVAMQMGKKFATSSISKIIQAIGLLPKSTPQGLIFNSITQEPISFAFMTIRGKSGDEDIEESFVSDASGFYQGIRLPAGVYKIDVLHPEYSFPSKQKRPAYLGESDFYQGREFIIGTANEQRLFSIPVDPKSKEEKDNIKKQDWLKRKAKQILLSYSNKKLNKYLLIYSIATYIFYPTMLNLFIATLYSIFGIKDKITLFSNPHLKGKIVDHSGNPLTNVIIRVSYLYNQIAASAISDNKGRFDLPLKKKQYFIELIKPGFEPDFQKPMVLETVDLRKKTQKIKITMNKE